MSSSSESGSDDLWVRRQFAGRSARKDDLYSRPDTDVAYVGSANDEDKGLHINVLAHADDRTPNTRIIVYRQNKKEPAATKDEPAIYPESPEPEPTPPHPPPIIQHRKHYDRHAHILWLLVLGYITGIVLVLFWYMLHPQRAKRDLTISWLLIVLLMLLLLILCHSRAARCVVTLLLPSMGSVRGRLLMLVMALFVAMRGPVMNILQNITVLMHSLSCGQLLLHQAITPMHDVMCRPIYAVEQAIFAMLSQVRRVMHRLEPVLEELELPLVRIDAAFEFVLAWLLQQQNSFENQMGTPHDRCLRAGQLSTKECLLKFGHDKVECQLQQRFDWFCGNLKDVAGFFCEKPQLPMQIFKCLQQRLALIRRIFEVSITFEHLQQDHDTHRSNSSELEAAVDDQLAVEFNKFLNFFICLNMLLFLLLLSIVWHANCFRWSYLFSKEFANFYVTRDFYDSEDEHKRNKGYAALPLHSTEQSKFVKLCSFSVLPMESRHARSFFWFWLLICLQLGTICFVDYSLHWMLTIMSFYTYQTSELLPPTYTKLCISHGGFLGDILRGLVQAFEPLVKYLLGDIHHCLPLPSAPNYMNYLQIIVLGLGVWLLLLLEPYTQRLHHCIMGCFYPDRARRRAQYLYTSIVLNRDELITTVRRRALLKQKFEDKNPACINRCCPCLVYCWRNCIICQKSLSRKSAVYCDTKNCPGIFCKQCFIDSNCHCIFCNPPASYGERDNISYVGDSSEDETNDCPYRPDNIYCDYSRDHCVGRHKSA